MKIQLYKVKIDIMFTRILSKYKEEGMTPENQVAWTNFVSKCKEYGLEPKPIPDQETYYGYDTAIEGVNDLVVDGQKALALLAAFKEASIERVIETEIDPAKIFEQVSSKAEAAVIGGQAVYNTKCDVHMPGQMLATYNELMLCEDSCTDVIQTKLAAGWRLVAVCPQPDQRRPDYILGRFNPEYDGNQSAQRGN